MTGLGLVDGLAAAGLEAVLVAAGAEVKGRAAGPCLACRVGRRGARDPRPPLVLSIRADREVFYCAACQVHGDAATAAALGATGEVLGRGNARDVARWAVERGLVRPLDTSSAPRAPRPAPPVAPRAVLLEPRRPPPVDEVAELWAHSRRVLDVPEAVAWLEGRGLSPAAVEDLDLARALPEGPLPRWARGPSGPWRDSGHLAIFPLFGPTGRLESVRARAVGPADMKSLAPLGYSVAGLVFADRLVRLVLAGEPLGDGRPAADELRRVGLVVTEGEPDFMTWATRSSDADEDAPGVLGLFAGGWSDEAAARIPDGTLVRLRTHDDEAGDRYAERVVDTLATRCRVVRARAQEPTP